MSISSQFVFIPVLLRLLFLTTDLTQCKIVIPLFHTRHPSNHNFCSIYFLFSTAMSYFCVTYSSVLVIFNTENETSHRNLNQPVQILAVTVWNTLPVDVISSTTLPAFKRLLKAELCSRSFSDAWYSSSCTWLLELFEWLLSWHCNAVL